MQSLRVGRKPRQSIFKLTNHAGQIVEHPIGKLFLPEFIPDVFLWIELGSIRREAYATYIMWESEVFGSMGTGAIPDHYNQFSRMRGADLGEELVHALGVHFIADHPIQRTFLRADRAIDIGELPFIAIVDHGAQRRWRPAAFDSDHAPESKRRLGCLLDGIVGTRVRAISIA